MNLQADGVAALLGRIPDLDKEGKFTGPDWGLAREVFDAILAGGREKLLGAVDLLKEIDDGQDYRARYALHGLAVYVAQPDQRKFREPFASALASQLGGARPKPVQAFLVRQLQVAGGQESIEPLERLLSDPELYDPAAQALLAIRAVEPFRRALASATAGRPRATILQALGVLGDAESAEAIRKALADPDRDTRAVAAWALGKIGDPAAAEPLLKAADGASGYERNRLTHACLVLAERLAAQGRADEAKKIYRHLRDTRTDPSEDFVRDAAERALAN